MSRMHGGDASVDTGSSDSPRHSQTSVSLGAFLRTAFRGRGKEFGVAVLVNTLGLLCNLLPVYQRVVPTIQVHIPQLDGSTTIVSARDPALSYPVVPQTVSGWWYWLIDTCTALHHTLPHSLTPALLLHHRLPSLPVSQIPMRVLITVIVILPLIILGLLAWWLQHRLPRFYLRDHVLLAMNGHALNNCLTHSTKVLVGRPRPNFYALVEIGKAKVARQAFPSGHR